MGGSRPLARYWLSAAIALTVLAGALFPGPGQVLPNTPIIDLTVMLVLLIGSIKIDPHQFLEIGRNLRLPTASMLSLFVVAPAISIALAHLFGFSDGSSKSAVLICSTAATTVATSLVLTEVAGGNRALAMTISALSNMLAVVAIPAIFRLTGQADVALDHGQMAASLSVKILVPLLAGQALRPWLGRWAGAHGRALSFVSQLGILVFVYAGVSTAGPMLLAGPANLLPRVLALVAVFHGLLLLVNLLIARWLTNSVDMRIAFLIGSSQKNLSVSMLVWKDHFGHLQLGPLFAVAYHIFQLVVDSIMAPDLKQYRLLRDRRHPDRKESNHDHAGS